MKTAMAKNSVSSRVNERAEVNPIHNLSLFA
jgi:hypothetical protein